MDSELFVWLVMVLFLPLTVAASVKHSLGLQGSMAHSLQTMGLADSLEQSKGVSAWEHRRNSDVSKLGWEKLPSLFSLKSNSS